MQGYVAFLDVLGFTALVSRDETGEKLKEFSTCLKKATDELEIDFVVFSDSIVLTAKSDTEDAFFSILQACSKLFASLLEQHIAIRGAIAFGAYQRQSMGESVFVAGTALIEAYRYETRQDWVGVMIAPSVRERIADLPKKCTFGVMGPGTGPQGPWAAFAQPCVIPFHGSPNEAREYHGFAVVPSAITATAVDNHRGIVFAAGHLERLRDVAPGPPEQEKYSRTVRWLYTVEEKWRTVYAKEIAAREQAERQRRNLP